jgi:hypothetical protein
LSKAKTIRSFLNVNPETRVGTNIAPAHEALGEEALDQRGDIAGGLHGVTPHP